MPEYEGEMYCNEAMKMLKALYAHHADFTTDRDNIFIKYTGACHNKKHEYPIIYRDFFFMETLFKVKRNGIFMR